jgi:hypothetical protein
MRLVIAMRISFIGNSKTFHDVHQGETKMQTIQTKPSNSVIHQETLCEVHHEKWAHCHVNWTAVGVGALTAFSLLLLFGLAGIAIGAHLLEPEHRVVDLRKLGMWTLIFSVCGAFFSFVAGGWAAGKIAGILHSEPGMLHGAITWLVTVPMLVVAAGLGSSSFFGGWYAGLGSNQTSATAANTRFMRPDRPDTNASTLEMTTYREQLAEYNRNVNQWREETPKATRNTAIGLATALLLGLIGCVIGGWWATGEPMNLTHHLTRKPMYHQPA